MRRAGLLLAAVVAVVLLATGVGLAQPTSSGPFFAPLTSLARRLACRFPSSPGTSDTLRNLPLYHRYSFKEGYFMCTLQYTVGKICS